MSPFHFVGILSVVIVVAVVTVGDDIAALIRSLFTVADPLQRALMDVCEQARRTR